MNTQTIDFNFDPDREPGKRITLDLVKILGNLIEAQRHLVQAMPPKKQCLYCTEYFEGPGDFCCQAHEDLYNAGESEANHREGEDGN